MQVIRMYSFISVSSYNLRRRITMHYCCTAYNCVYRQMFQTVHIQKIYVQNYPIFSSTFYKMQFQFSSEEK